MTLIAARNVILSDRMDWRKPHLKWLSNGLYRTFSLKRR